MSANEWNALQLIVGIRREYRRARESLQVADVATTLSILECLQKQTEALHESHLNLIHHQLMILEPLLQHLNRLLAKLVMDRAEAGGWIEQTPGCREETSESKRS